MRVPEELKCNKFKLVDIPSNKDFFARRAEVLPAPNMYSQDELVPRQQNKLDEYAQLYDEYKDQLEGDYDKDEA